MMPAAIVVMGVSGTGKSTIAKALAEAIGFKFIEGDDCHPPENVAKMAAGTALTDADRERFLDNVGAALAAAAECGAVASCSALKRDYRDHLRRRCPGVRFVYPVLTREQLVHRLAARKGHFMPSSLLESQLATLEPPTPDEDPVMVDGALPVEAQVAAAISALA